METGSDLSGKWIPFVDLLFDPGVFPADLMDFLALKEIIHVRPSVRTTLYDPETSSFHTPGLSSSRVNFQEQYGTPGPVSGGHDRHVTSIRESMVRANTGNSIRPTDLQGNEGIPFLSLADCTRQLVVVTMSVLSSGRWISRVLRSEASRCLKAISSASSPP